MNIKNVKILKIKEANESLEKRYRILKEQAAPAPSTPAPAATTPPPATPATPATPASNSGDTTNKVQEFIKKNTSKNFEMCSSRKFQPNQLKQIDVNGKKYGYIENKDENTLPYVCQN